MMKKIIIAAIFVLAGLIFSGCSEPEDDRNTYTITFDSTYTVFDGGAWVKYNESPTVMQTNTLGRLSQMPASPSRSDDYYFDGWFTSGGTSVTVRTVFTSDTSVFARWNTTVAEVKPLANYLRGVRDGDMESGDVYDTFRVSANEVMGPQILHYPGKNNIAIKLTGLTGTGGVVPIIKLAARGSLFTIGDGVTLEIDNVWLEGYDRNSDALITVNRGGKLILRQSGSGWTKVYGNGGEEINSGGGIQVNEGGVFEMWGGEISDNVSFDMSGEVGYRGRGGGGVLVRGGTFYMHGGSIFNNSASDGGGVMVALLGKFYMYGGEIHRNMGPSGGGVHIYHSLFEMYGGEIHDNQAIDGGGVFVNYNRGGAPSANPYDPDKTEEENAAAGYAPKQGFFMYGGKIYKNSAGSAGGGVHNNFHAYTYIYSGEIYENTGWSIAGISNGGHLELGRRGGVYPAPYTVSANGQSYTITETVPDIYANEGGAGGGVDVYDIGIFIMWDGKIRDNVADGTGGGVMALSFFFMHGGEIYGNRSNGGPGGGVYVRPAGAFFMSGGTVYGDDAENYNASAAENIHNAGGQTGSSLFFAFDVWNDPGSAYYGTLPENGKGNYIEFPFDLITLPDGSTIDGEPKTALKATDKTMRVIAGELVDKDGNTITDLDDWD